MLKFFKYQGLGNDFVLFDSEEATLLAAASPNSIRAVCNRRLGIGGDGILLTPPPTKGATIRMVYFNADGSPAETCFNGLRCVALHAIRSKRAKPGGSFIIESPSGPVNAMVDGIKGEATTELAGPTFAPSEVPVKSEFEVIETHLAFPFGSLSGTALSIGNPHFVSWKEETLLSELISESELIGESVEKSRHFPNGTNFELATLRSPSLVEMAVWERGVGPTLACGSGATATVCAGVKSGRIAGGKPIRVRMPGGELTVEVSEDFNRVRVTGGAEFVFEGFIDKRILKNNN